MSTNTFPAWQGKRRSGLGLHCGVVYKDVSTRGLSRQDLAFLHPYLSLWAPPVPLPHLFPFPSPSLWAGLASLSPLYLPSLQSHQSPPRKWLLADTFGVVSEGFVH